MKLITQNLKSFRLRYPDITLFLVLIPCISAFNYYLTYPVIRWGWYLAFTFAIDTCEGYLAWWAVRSIILYLDQRMPYDSGTTKRIFVQIILTTAIGLVIIILLTELVSWIVNGKPAVMNFYTEDIFIISIWFLVINGFYIGYHYYRQWKTLVEERKEEKREIPEGIVVRYGKQNFRLLFENVAGFYVDGEYVVVSSVHSNGAAKKYYIDQSLDQLEKALPSSLFFRLNRQYILHRQMMEGFKKEESGKLGVMIIQHAHFPSHVSVSRLKANAFKSWFNQTHLKTGVANGK
jgi:hypothetical protein